MRTILPSTSLPPERFHNSLRGNMFLRDVKQSTERADIYSTSLVFSDYNQLLSMHSFKCESKHFWVGLQCLHRFISWIESPYREREKCLLSTKKTPLFLLSNWDCLTFFAGMANGHANEKIVWGLTVTWSHTIVSCYWQTADSTPSLLGTTGLHFGA